MSLWSFSRESPHEWFTRRNEAVGNPDITPDDVEMTALCERYAESSASERAALRASPPSEKLLLFAERMATKAMRTGSSKYIRLGLLALSVEDQQFDFRDSAAVAAGICHAANYMSFNMLPVAHEVMQLTSDYSSRLFLPYTLSQSTSLGRYRLHQITDRNGVMIAWMTAP